MIKRTAPERNVVLLQCWGILLHHLPPLLLNLTIQKNHDEKNASIMTKGGTEVQKRSKVGRKENVVGGGRKEKNAKKNEKKTQSRTGCLGVSLVYY